MCCCNGEANISTAGYIISSLTWCRVKHGLVKSNVIEMVGLTIIQGTFFIETHTACKMGITCSSHLIINFDIQLRRISILQIIVLTMAYVKIKLEIAFSFADIKIN